jgi:F0F1-type ATP synthase assembly protein I
MPRWVCIIILFVGFLAGVLTFPSTTNSNTADTTTSSAVADNNFYV